MKKRLWRLGPAALIFGVLIARELRKPAGERTWTGTLAGIVPYDLRLPTPKRLRSSLWAPNDPHVLTPKPFGIGWNLNLGRLVAIGRRRRSNSGS
ncbi:MAG: DUF5808 domain-containing protein [Acidimicrobiales bacterium]